MKKLVVLLLASLMASSAFAVADPDPDMLGIYFDPNADTNCTTTLASVPFNAYLILTNPTGSFVDAYELSYTNVTPAGFEALFFILGTTLPPGGIDIGDGTGTQGEMAVGIATPVATSAATILATWQMMTVSVPFQVDMYLGPSSSPSLPGGLPVIQQDGALQTVGTSTGGPDIPVAQLNGANCPVAVEDATWGSMKSLYR